MQIVIDIDETIYNSIKIGMRNRDEVENIMEQIEKGTPLPKNHGRLIDADAYEKDIRKHYFDNATVIRCTEIGLQNAPTVIEADKEVENAEICN